MLARGIPANAPADFVTIKSGHLDVEQHEVHSQPKLRERFDVVARRLRLVPQPLDDGGGERAGVLVVVHHQHVLPGTERVDHSADPAANAELVSGRTDAEGVLGSAAIARSIRASGAAASAGASACNTLMSSVHPSTTGAAPIIDAVRLRVCAARSTAATSPRSRPSRIVNSSRDPSRSSTCATSEPSRRRAGREYGPAAVA